MAYSPQIPAPVQRTAADGLRFGNTLLLNTTGNGTPLFLADELKGGLHLVEYLEYLIEDSYRGISIGRRQLGMIAFVARHYDDGADRWLGKYYKLAALSADGVDATWEELPFGSSTLAPSRVFTVATIAERNALAPEPELREGDIVVVADASGDASVVPALEGGATYIRTATGDWLRFLFPKAEDTWRHKQGTDRKLQRETPTGEVIDLTSDQIHEHMQDPHIHFRINDAAEAGGDITWSVDEIMRRLSLIKGWQPKKDGDGTRFLNDKGEYVEVQTKIRRIDGGSAASIFV